MRLSRSWCQVRCLLPPLPPLLARALTLFAAVCRRQQAQPRAECCGALGRQKEDLARRQRCVNPPSFPPPAPFHAQRCCCVAGKKAELAPKRTEAASGEKKQSPNRRSQRAAANAPQESEEEEDLGTYLESCVGKSCMVFNPGALCALCVVRCVRHGSRLRRAGQFLGSFAKFDELGRMTDQQFKLAVTRTDILMARIGVCIPPSFPPPPLPRLTLLLCAGHWNLGRVSTYPLSAAKVCESPSPPPSPHPLPRPTLLLCAGRLPGFV